MYNLEKNITDDDGPDIIFKPTQIKQIPAAYKAYSKVKEEQISTLLIRKLICATVFFRYMHLIPQNASKIICWFMEI